MRVYVRMYLSSSVSASPVCPFCVRWWGTCCTTVEWSGVIGAETALITLWTIYTLACLLCVQMRSQT